MSDAASLFLTPIAAAALLWWLGAGAVLAVERGVPRMGGARFLIAALGLAAALWATARSLSDASSTGAYLGFAGAIGIWGWHEIAFLSGWLTGPRRARCPADATGWRRFRLAALTLIHHEIALALTLVALVAASWSAANPIAAAAFGALWIMRLSAKLNLFFGVPNLAAGLLPEPLEHMKSYFRRRGFSALLAASILGALAAAGVAAEGALRASVSDYEIAASLLMATLLGLGALEHAFMAAPIRDTLLWRWAFATEKPNHRGPAGAPERHLRINTPSTATAHQ